MCGKETRLVLSQLLKGPRKARTPQGRRIYAVGDIHGRADLLAQLLTMIDADRRLGAYEGLPVLLFIGDYVDRGVASKDVVDQVLALEGKGYELRFLKGNHEAAMMSFLESPEAGPTWFALGGAETLYSYGVSVPRTGAGPTELRLTSKALRAAIPPDHMRFYMRLELFARYGDYFFVHAGLKPGRDLQEQSERDLLEIREPFTKNRKAWPFVVVHGHTPNSSVVDDGVRIGIDTGAYATGKLTCLRLQDEQVASFST
jgi:serine/threonine protein phosphatase 1